MSRTLRIVLTLLGSAAVAVPVSVVVTILLFPFWSWIEASTGFESVGHSGPAVWCYATVFVVLAVGGAYAWLHFRRERSDGEQ